MRRRILAHPTVNPEQVLDYPHAAPPPPGGTVEVAPGVHWLRMPLPFALNHINLWLLEDGDRLVIVDCGFAASCGSGTSTISSPAAA